MKNIRKQSPQSLTGKAYRHIRTEICESRIAPGEPLSENTIAQQLCMSRTPVREALHMLAMEGLVEIRSGVGTYVKPSSWNDIRDIFEVRRELELLAVRTAVYTITEREVDALERRFTELLAQYEEGRLVEAHKFTTLDWEFHDLLVARGRNDYVKSIMESINSNIRRYQMLSYEALGSVQESTQQHLKLLELLRGHDVPALEQELSRHIDWSLHCLFCTM